MSLTTLSLNVSAPSAVKPVCAFSSLPGRLVFHILHGWLPLTIQGSSQITQRGFPSLLYLNILPCPLPLAVLFLFSFFIALYLLIDCLLHWNIKVCEGKTHCLSCSNVNKNALLNYYNILRLWWRKLKWDRICLKGRRGRRIIIWQLQLLFNDCLPFTRRCADVFVYISSELSKSIVTRPALASGSLYDAAPHISPGSKAGDPPPNWGASGRVAPLSGFILQSKHSSERLSTLPKAVLLTKGSIRVPIQFSVTRASFPTLPLQLSLVLRKQLHFVSSLLVA